jgi:CspA family cold shock protein
MPMGTVRSYNLAKGYGFITPDDGGADLYAHVNAITESPHVHGGLEQGERVLFDIEPGPAGKLNAAVHIRVRGRAAEKKGATG